MKLLLPLLGVIGTLYFLIGTFLAFTAAPIVLASIGATMLVGMLALEGVARRRS